MEQNEIVSEQQEKTEADILIEYQKTHVLKSELDAANAEKEKYRKALLEGEQIQEIVEAKEVDLDELRDSLFNGNNNSLEYVQKALQLRDELINKGERDPFLANDPQYIPSDSEKARVQFVADKLKEMVEYADGNPYVFTNELQRNLNEDSPALKAYLNSKGI